MTVSLATPGVLTDQPHSGRFWAKVHFTEGCWLWAASLNIHGYGQFTLDGRPQAAYRVAYELVRGAIPKGLELDHLCRNKLCVNPDHLEAVTHTENIRRGQSPPAKNARRTHCSRGHEFDDENTYRPPKRPWQRHCKTCQREARATCETVAA